MQMRQPTTTCKAGIFQGCFDSPEAFVTHQFDASPRDFAGYGVNGIFDAACYAHDCRFEQGGAYEFLPRTDGKVDVWYVG
jgi:hypothetical protein